MATTLVVFVSGMLLLGERSLIKIILVPAVLTAAIFYSFTELLQV